MCSSRRKINPPGAGLDTWVQHSLKGGRDPGGEKGIGLLLGLAEIISGQYPAIHLGTNKKPRVPEYAWCALPRPILKSCPTPRAVVLMSISIMLYDHYRMDTYNHHTRRTGQEGSQLGWFAPSPGCVADLAGSFLPPQPQAEGPHFPRL